MRSFLHCLRASLVSATLLAMPAISMAQPVPGSESSGSVKPDAGLDLNSLVGRWYAAGDISSVCSVSRAGDDYYLINEKQTPFTIFAAQKNTIIAKAPGLVFTALVLPDFILWDNGYWWSRKPVAPAGGKDR